MRLIRLVTEDPQAVFDNTFNEDLVVPENSKLALQSLSIETENNVIIIDDSNDEISYQSTTGFTKTIFLDHATYTRGNFHDLFTDITNKLNETVGFTTGTEEIRRNFGLEWLARVNPTHKKAVIEYEIGVNGAYEDDFSFDATKVEFVNNLTRRVCRAKAGQPNNTGNDRSARFETFISRGCSFIRGRTHTYGNTLGLAQQANGYIIGLSNEDLSGLDPTTITDDKLTFGIAVTCDVANTRQYYVVSDGVYTLSATVPNFNGDGDVDNDYQEVIINFNKVQGNVYQNGSNIPVNLFDVNYTAGQKLFPFLIFRGTNASINSIRTIPSPNGAITQASGINELSAPPQPQRNASENFIQLSLDLATFLGFDNPREPQLGFDNVVEATYVADKTFDPEDIADAFIVELLNLKCMSYDGLKNQRKNILSVIPKSNANGEIIYEMNNPIFIDLNNAKPLLMRNLRIRVTKPDYSPVKMVGQATMVLLLN
tara:strand:- start:1729 stop:3180 length:1452 start_codon:yes stop_codon:yes gene_type:complete